MSEDLNRLDATEQARIETELIKCRVLAAKIANELRNKDSQLPKGRCRYSQHGERLGGAEPLAPPIIRVPARPTLSGRARFTEDADGQTQKQEIGRTQGEASYFG